MTQTTTCIIDYVETKLIHERAAIPATTDLKLSIERCATFARITQLLYDITEYSSYVLDDMHRIIEREREEQEREERWQSMDWDEEWDEEWEDIHWS